eukprot:9493141-Pyramimonas_sp.AAC.1
MSAQPDFPSVDDLSVLLSVPRSRGVPWAALSRSGSCFCPFRGLAPYPRRSESMDCTAWHVCSRCG